MSCTDNPNSTSGAGAKNEAERFLDDAEKRLLDLNPHSVHSLTKRLVEAHDRGYWNPEEEIVERLRDIVADLQVDMGAA